MTRHCTWQRIELRLNIASVLEARLEGVSLHYVADTMPPSPKIVANLPRATFSKAFRSYRRRKAFRQTPLPYPGRYTALVLARRLGATNVRPDEYMAGRVGEFHGEYEQPSAEADD